MLTRKELTDWTTFLRNNPDLQGEERLIDGDGKMCCLGALCKIQGLEVGPYDDFLFPHSIAPNHVVVRNEDNYLTGDLEKKFGSRIGKFDELSMPLIKFRDVEYYSLSAANDAGVPWSEIADHLDKYYPAETDVAA